jgi:D-alanyl-D-alanine carboxypeptidase/D-alanyl-D-alanine-endopeptidase (penicillin-binding protein 4)
LTIDDDHRASRKNDPLIGRLSLVVAFLSGLAVPFGFGIGTAGASDDLARSLRIVEEHGFAPGRVGFMRASVDGGGGSLAHQPDRAFIPASTIKIATAIAADSLLGGEYRFSTELLADGRIENGVIIGDLWLRGTGDPRLEPEALLDLAMAARRFGIRDVDGRLMIDDTAFPRSAVINPTQPDDAYNAGIGALLVGFNRVTLHWNRSGHFTVPPLVEAAISVRPSSGGATIIDRQVRSDGLAWRIDAPRSSGRIALPVADAGLHAGHLFKRMLADLGIGIGDVQRGTLVGETRMIDRHRGPDVRSILRDMLHYSNNQIAEMVGMASAVEGGARLAGDGPEAIAEASAFTSAHLAAIMPEVDWSGMAMHTHSGLETEGRLTPSQMMAMLVYGHDRLDLPTLLPAAAYSGTLARRFEDDAAAMRIWAKTGTIFYGSAMAGYMFAGSSAPEAFVIMVSDLEKRAAFDASPERHLEMAPAAARWSERAQALQDALLRDWLRD